MMLPMILSMATPRIKGPAIRAQVLDLTEMIDKSRWILGDLSQLRCPRMLDTQGTDRGPKMILPHENVAETVGRGFVVDSKPGGYCG